MEFLFSFQGRVTRKSWWIIAVTSYVLTLVISWVWALSAYSGGMDPDYFNGNAYSFAWTSFANASLKAQVFIFLGSSFTFWIWAASNVKRYHDLGKSGFWTLIYFIPLIGPLWNLIECGFIPGMSGENQYDHSGDDKTSSFSFDMNDNYQEKPVSQKESTAQPISLGRHNFAAEEKGPKPLFGS